jgi:hypothetical protein
MDSKAAEFERNHNLKLVFFLGCNNSTLSRPIPAVTVPVTPPPRVRAQVFRTAERKLRKKSRDSEGPVEVVPIPKGEPMFMYQALKGKTRPVNGSYDSGCSKACLRTGIPGAQLKGQVLAKGPFNITGVNGVNITAQDEWLVHLDREDGRKQLL